MPAILQTFLEKVFMGASFILSLDQVPILTVKNYC